MNEGIVYTFRWHKRKKTGKDWAQVKRNTKKMCDVHIEEIGSITNLYQLKDYVESSGFSHIGAWATVIMNMHKPGSQMIGWMYKVTLRDVITYEITCGGCGTTQIRKNLPEKMMCGECQEAYYVEEYQEIHSLNSQQKRMNE